MAGRSRYLVAHPPAKSPFILASLSTHPLCVSLSFLLSFQCPTAFLVDFCGFFSQEDHSFLFGASASSSPSLLSLLLYTRQVTLTELHLSLSLSCTLDGFSDRL